MAPTESEGGVFITTEQIYNLVRETHEEVKRLGTLMETSQKKDDDHEDRIRKIERWKYGTPAAFITSVLSIVIALSRATGKP